MQIQLKLESSINTQIIRKHLNAFNTRQVQQQHPHHGHTEWIFYSSEKANEMYNCFHKDMKQHYCF